MLSASLNKTFLSLASFYSIYYGFYSIIYGALSVGCDEDIMVKRPRFYSSPNLNHLFTQVPGHQILSFLKAIGLYGKF